MILALSMAAAATARSHIVFNADGWRVDRLADACTIGREYTGSQTVRQKSAFLVRADGSNHYLLTVEGDAVQGVVDHKPYNLTLVFSPKGDDAAGRTPWGEPVQAHGVIERVGGLSGYEAEIDRPGLVDDIASIDYFGYMDDHQALISFQVEHADPAAQAFKACVAELKN